MSKINSYTKFVQLFDSFKTLHPLEFQPIFDITKSDGQSVVKYYKIKGCPAYVEFIKNDIYVAYYRHKIFDLTPFRFFAELCEFLIVLRIAVLHRRDLMTIDNFAEVIWEIQNDKRSLGLRPLFARVDTLENSWDILSDEFKKEMAYHLHEI
jgi:hypothetical protein